MAKNHEVKVKLSDEEHKKISDKAKKLGMTISGYLRTMGLVANFNQS